MDFDAAYNADTRAWRFTRAGMLTCCVLASAMLVASLALANGSHPTPGSETLLQSTLR
jgi:hypothetical protein